MMRTFGKYIVGAGIAAALSACGQAQPGPTAAAPTPPAVDQAAEAAKARVEELNKKVVADFFGGGLSREERMKMMLPEYIQHNPQVIRFSELNNVHGPEAYKAFFETRAKVEANSPPEKGPKPPEGKRAFLMMADGDLVTVLHQRYLPDPAKAGAFYEAYGFDTFRLRDGKFVEHWDEWPLPSPLPAYLRVPADQLQYPPQKK